MASVREGNRVALVVVDVQVGVMADAWQAPRVIGNVARTVARAREQGVPVLWVQHTNHELPRDSAPWQWVPELQPMAGEARIHKQFNSAFEQTPLDDELARLGTTHLVLAGAASNWCIRATAYGALDRGYDLTLVSDAHTTSDMPLPGGATVEAARVIDDLNITMTWLAYPDRKNGVATAEQLDFNTPGGVR